MTSILKPEKAFLIQVVEQGRQSFQTFFNHIKTNEMTVRLSVCLYRKILLTAEPIWFSFTI